MPRTPPTPATFETGGTELVQPNLKAQQTFLKQFTDATHVEWRQLQKNYYISFSNRGQKSSTVISPNGIIKYTVTNCTINQLQRRCKTKLQNTMTAMPL